MRRLFVVSALICGLLGLSMPTAWASGPDALRAEGLRGNPSVRLSAQAEWQSLDGSADLVAGASLRTGSDAEALMELPGGTTLRISPDSRVQVSGLEEGEVALHLESGRIFASVPATGEGVPSLRVTTPTGKAVSRGGEFTMKAGAEATTLQVLAGEARLSGASVTLDGARVASAGDIVVPEGVEAVAQTDQGDQGGGGTEGAGGTGGGGGAGGGGGQFPIFAVLGGVALVAIIAILVSQSSEVQST